MITGEEKEEEEEEENEGDNETVPRNDNQCWGNFINPKILV